MVNIEDMHTVYRLARANKRRSADAVLFEMHFEKNLQNLCDAINERTYRANANYTFITYKPKPREVFGCELEARIIQWYIVWRINGLLEKAFTKRTFNNRVGMGTDKAVECVYNDIREVSKNYTRDAYIIQWDLKGYFPNANCDIVSKQLKSLINEGYEGEDKEDLLWMVDISVLSNPQRHCYRKSPLWMWEDIEKGKSLFEKDYGTGGAIGFLIFQTAMNLYLNYVDHWAVDDMGLHYTRFVDDTVIVVENKDVALTLLPKFRELYKETGTIMHPKKFYCQHYSKGLRFLGRCIRFDRIYTDNRIVRNAEKKIIEFNNVSNKLAKIDKFISSINSYFGIFKHCNEYKNIVRLYGMINGQWKKYIHLDYDRLCVVANNGYSYHENVKLKYSKI